MHIRPMTSADIPEVAEVACKSFSPKTDELTSRFYPNTDEDSLDIYMSHLLRNKKRILEPGIVGFVAVTDNEDSDFNGKSRILGYAFWKREGSDAEAKKWQQDSITKKLDRYLISWELWYERYFIDRSTSWDVLEAFFTATGVCDPLYDSIGNYWHLTILGVHPGVQRRGIGRKLVQWGLQTASQEAVPVTLESSPTGRSLYTYLGFYICQLVQVLDLEEGAFMVWEPEHLQGQWLEKETGEKGHARLKTLG